jgi:hypothetical protein
MLERLLLLFGASPGEPPAYYRDVALGIIAIPAAVIAGLLAVAGSFTLLFWGCSLTLAATLFFARKRMAIVAGIVAFTGLRFLFGFFISQRLDALLLALVCLVILAAIAHYGSFEYSSRR